MLQWLLRSTSSPRGGQDNLLADAVASAMLPMLRALFSLGQQYSCTSCLVLMGCACACCLRLLLIVCFCLHVYGLWWFGYIIGTCLLCAYVCNNMLCVYACLHCACLQ